MKKTLLLFVALLSLASTTFAQTINLPDTYYYFESCGPTIQLDGTVINTNDTNIRYQWYVIDNHLDNPSFEYEIPGATNPIYNLVVPENYYDYYYYVVATLSNRSTIKEQVVIRRPENNQFNEVCEYRTVEQTFFYNVRQLSYTFFLTNEDAMLGQNQLEPSQYISDICYDSFCQVYVRIEDSYQPNCFEVQQLYLNVSYNPNYAGSAPNIGSCSQNAEEISVFDLTKNNAKILGNYNSGSVDYFLNEEDAISGSYFSSGRIRNPENFIPTEPNQTIYARLSGTVCNEWSDAGIKRELVRKFQVRSVIKPTPNNEVNYLGCDSSNGNDSDGIGIFDLTSRIPIILSGMNNYDVNFYPSLTDAENGTSTARISNPSSYSSVNNIVYCRVQDATTDCYHISKLNLIVHDTCEDISVNLISYRGAPRPGFTYSKKLVITNKGPETVSAGTVVFEKDPILTYNSATGLSAGNTLDVTETGFTLSFINIAPGESEEIFIGMTVPSSAELGDIITNTATYTTDSNDIDQENDMAVLSEIIRGSYDPNDIAESHGPEIVYESFTENDYLYYTIRFQNIGTASAIFVTIENTLQAELDKTTFEMLSASHTYTLNRDFDKLSWRFDDINLAAESIDEPNSHGYVYYKIKPLPGYKVSDIINNDASIVFDFNAPIVTNTFKTEFIAKSFSTNLITKRSDVSIMPNPSNGIVNMSSLSNNPFEKIEVYDMLGKLVYEKNNIGTQHIVIDISTLENGIYIIKVKTTEGKVSSNRLIKN